MAPDRGTRRSWGRPPARPRIGGDGGESNSPSRNHRRRPLRACPIVCRRTLGRPSATCRALQSRSLAGFSSDYATLLGTAPPLNDASAAHGGEAVSTFTLLPKQRGRKQTGCCQLLRLGSFLRGLETNLDSRSPVTGPCRNHASPQRLATEFSPRCGARGLYSAPAAGQIESRARPAGPRLAGSQPLYLDGPTFGYDWKLDLSEGPNEELWLEPSAAV
jgi:hypothetical protein